MTGFSDLESEIMKCWQVTDDIDTLFSHVCESDFGKLDNDQISNALLGIKTLYDIKFSKLFETYEAVLRSLV